MAQPQWTTSAGSLGVIAEGSFFNTPVIATDADGGTVKYILQAGELPEGIQVRINGTIEGVPVPFARVQGVPTEVGEDVTSTFVIRAYVEENGTTRINDRTFSLTVTGQDLPQFTTAAGSLGTFYTGGVVDIDIEFTDADPGETLVASIESGQLPPGLTLSSAGNISGYILNTELLDEDAVPGYDASQYDEYPWDFPTRNVNRNYEFTVAITDGKEKAIRTFSIFVVSRSSLTADNQDEDPDNANDTGFLTADNELVTSDNSPLTTPFITNYPTDGNIGTYRHDNFFAYQFESLDLDGDAVEYSIVFGDSSDLPPGLILDTATGWLTGFLPDQGATEITYSFSLNVRKASDQIFESADYDYTIKIIGDIETEITWVTNTNLGFINNGDISTLVVEATTTLNKPLLYRLKSGNYPEVGGVSNQLPQGLSLLSSGSISGRVSFNGFTLDSGTTTFDQQRSTRLEIDPTTFDSKYTFTVNAYTSDGLVSVFKEFYVVVNRTYASPYERLYIKAMPPAQDRSLVNDLLLNQDIFIPSLIYRKDDPYFGVARNIEYTNLYSVDTASLDEYVIALNENHFRKKLILGEIKTAQALDSSGNVLYEVVYSEVVDTGVNQQGESPPQSVEVPFPFEQQGDSTLTTEVNPNSLINMRDRIIDTIGQTNVVLPLWMTSKQADGRILGFTKAWVLAYTNPGESDRIAYNVRTIFGEILNRVDFIADRYILDKSLTKNWVVNEDSTDGGNWLASEETTFNYDQDTNPTVSGDPTTFDADSMKFISPVDNYEFTDKYDKYLVFPKTNILG